jgi:hypothetical protein
MKDIILLVFLASGELHETHYPDNIEAEWQCVQDAAKAQENGNKAYCIIPPPDAISQREAYPDD